MASAEKLEESGKKKKKIYIIIFLGWVFQPIYFLLDFYLKKKNKIKDTIK